MSALKPEFVASLAAVPQFAGLAEALERTEPSVSIRLNPAREPEGYDSARRVPWWPAGRYLPERPKFTFDPTLHQGRYYVQDASSMSLAAIVAYLAEQFDEPIRYLDACAAPGGKTTAAIDALPPDAFVVANEFDFRRAAILAENVAKWGYGRTVVSRGDTARFRRRQGLFHIVAVDAPCSGEGMMRKDAEAVAQWSPELVAQCAARQRAIIDNVWPAIAPGGYLIYSTCTFNMAENEDVALSVLHDYGAESVPLPPGDFPGVIGSLRPELHAARFLPGRVEGEGLFITVLRKPDGAPFRMPRQRSEKPAKSILPVKDWLSGEWIGISESGTAKGSGAHTETLHAVAADLVPPTDLLRRELDVIDFGISAAALRGRDLQPLQPLALSRNLRREAFPAVEVDLPTALTYLRREAVAVPDAPKGHVLLTFGGCPLGFVKNLGTRSNNLYPASWRVLSRPD